MAKPEYSVRKRVVKSPEGLNRRLLGQPLCKYELMLEAIPSTSLWRASTLAQPM